MKQRKPRVRRVDRKIQRFRKWIAKKVHESRTSYGFTDEEYLVVRKKFNEIFKNY